MKQKFEITGMSCSSCSNHIERDVSKLNGVRKVQVNLLSNNMIVDYDEKLLTDINIINIVKQAGYNATIQGKSKDNKENKETINEQTSMKKRLILSIVFLIPLMYISMYHMFYEWFSLPIPNIIKNTFHGHENAINFSFTQFLLLLTKVLLNFNYFKVGYKALFKKAPNMDSLIAIGSSAAILYGIIAIFRIGYGLGHGDLSLVARYSMDIYFESAGTILTLITLGKYLEAKSKGKTGDAIRKLINLVPKTALIERDGKETEVAFEDIRIDDIVIIRPGESIPVDGIIIDGKSVVDQSAITGESIPVEKNVGDIVIAGTINKTGFFKFKADKVGENTTLSQIIKLVESAANSKAPISKLADKISGVFVPVVILIAIISVIVWIILGQSFEFALSIGIAVLVISCPCALGLATPVAIMVGTGKGAENGILIKSAESLQILHSVNTVVLDKTGTITEGKPKVVDILPKSNISKEELLVIAGSLEEKSEHPLAEAIVEEFKKINIKAKEVFEFESFSGKGIKAKIDNSTYLSGNILFMKENSIVLEDIELETNSYSQQGKTHLYFAKDNRLIGIITLKDTIKKSSKLAVDELKKLNIDVIMLTGDNKFVAENIKNELNIDKAISEVLPQDKENVINKLKLEGNKVAMCGDGINDSPALVRADVGIAIGSGTDIAIESADIVLIKNDLIDLVTAIKLSKTVIKNIKINLFWAFFYNVIGIPLAAGMFYGILGWKLNPMFGAAAMSLSSLTVVLNALRIRKFKSSYKLKEVKNMKKVIFVEGMQCMHCKMSIEKALSNLNEIKDLEVNLENNSISFEIQNESDLQLVYKLIEELGYKIISN